MIVDQQVDVGHIGRKRYFVEKHPDQGRDIDCKHQSPGVLSQAQNHSAPEKAVSLSATIIRATGSAATLPKE
jgi:hypothetical protein